MATLDIPDEHSDTSLQSYPDSFGGDIFDTDAFRSDSVGYDSSEPEAPTNTGLIPTLSLSDEPELVLITPDVRTRRFDRDDLVVR